MDLKGLLVYSNILTAASAGALSAGILHLSGTSFHTGYPIFAASSVLFVYNGQRLYKARHGNQETEWLSWVRKHSSLSLILTVFSALACIITGWYCIPASVFNLWILLTGVLLSIIYVVPIRSFTLRQVPALKNVVVAIVWTIILIVIPLGNSFPTAGYALFGLYFFGLSLPFDTRDMQSDKSSIVTLPHLLGAPITLLIAVLCIAVFYLAFTLLNPEFITNPLYWVSAVFPIVIILGSSPGRSYAYPSLLDLSMAILGVALLVQ